MAEEMQTSFPSSVYTVCMSSLSDGLVNSEETCSVLCQARTGYHLGSSLLQPVGLLLFALLAVSFFFFSIKVKKQVMARQQIESHARDRHLTLPRNYSESHLKLPSYPQEDKIFGLKWESHTQTHRI